MEEKIRKIRFTANSKTDDTESKKIEVKFESFLSLNENSVQEFFIERRCGVQKYVALPPRKEKEMSKCKNLVDIAASMLNGENIELPFDTANTKWKFKQTVDVSSCNKTKFRWNFPWEQANSPETIYEESKLS